MGKGNAYDSVICRFFTDGISYWASLRHGYGDCEMGIFYSYKGTQFWKKQSLHMDFAQRSFDSCCLWHITLLCCEILKSFLQLIIENAYNAHYNITEQKRKEMP